MESPAGEHELGRLTWRCRRGMKELDLLLTGYLGECWVLAGSAEKAAFEHILELPDPLLAAYLMERDTPADPDVQSLLAILRGRAAGRLPAFAPPATAPGLARP
ncbi:MAG: succinate dehydrogenase assembly factor 2 [Steroidobacteraceae bacterium]